MTKLEVIYKEEYWDKWKADTINNQTVAEFLVDWYINSGIWGIKIPQRLLKVMDDGIVGPVTVSILNQANQSVILNLLKDLRINYLKYLVIQKPSQSKFLNGWINRVNSFTYSA